MSRSTHDYLPLRGHKPKRLSLDSLPPYYSPGHPRSTHSDPASDSLPEYPDSADEADHEDDEEQHFHSPRKHQFLARPSSRRRSHNTPRSSISKSLFYNSQSSAISDSHLDSLLERSVHALEMSNALLQSSTSHRQSYITSPRYDLRESRTPPRRYQPVRRKPQFVQEPWMKELAELADSVDDLFGDEARNPVDNGHGISRSLPSSDFSMPSPKISNSARLRYGQNETYFRSPPPRQLTQYTSAESSNGSTHISGEAIQLPSTTGLRSGGIVSQLPPSTPRTRTRRSYSHDSTARPASASASASAGTSPAHSYLSQFGIRPGRSSSLFSSAPHDFHSSDGGRTIGRRRISQSRTSSRDSSSSRRSMSPLPTLEIRPMTPPLEESTPPSSESSTPAASQALECLRKILHDAPEPSKRARFPPPPILPDTRASPSAPQESNTTASITRLHSRGTHRSSTSDPPPKQSSLKQAPSPLLSPGQISPASSGRSTPRHKVQFAELPESYSSSKPGSRKSSNKSSKSKKNDPGGWWKTFWSAGDGYSRSRLEDRIEDRVARSWGRPPFGVGGLDEWSIQ